MYPQEDILVWEYQKNDKHLSEITCFTQQQIHNSRTQPAFTFSKLTIETLEQGVKYVQS